MKWEIRGKGRQRKKGTIGGRKRNEREKKGRE